MISIIAVSVFILGYVLIVFESKTKVSKSAIALLTGGILWVLVGFHDQMLIEEEMLHTGYDIFNLVVFLLIAMSLVEILIHYRIFEVVKNWLTKKHLSEKGLFFVICAIAFLLSSIIDNLTTTIIMIQIARKFFWEENLLVAASGIVIAANAGGAFSPIGDVTTIMIWLAEKFTATQILTQGFLASLTLLVVGAGLLSFKIKEQQGMEGLETNDYEPLSRSEKLVVATAGLSFLLPIIVKSIGLPPVFGLIIGLGVTWILIDSLKAFSKVKTHLTASIEHLVQKTDISSLKFFVGILLAVSALGSLGVLEDLSHVVYGEDQTMFAVIGGNIFLGLLSAVLDNIPLTAIAIEILQVVDPRLWVLLALTVGTGGSLLIIGSAAGVIAMGMVKKLTFEKYFKIAFMPALLSYFAGIAVWGLQVYITALI